MEELLQYRFEEGSLAGQSFGNLFLAAMNGISDSFEEAVRRMGEVLAITGRVLPVTNENIHLEAVFENGSRCLGESKIFYAKKVNDCRIRQVRLVPEHPKALPASLEAIREADLIVMGPGSLYTSIIPNFLVDGISEAVADSKALKILIMNIMSQDGETEGYTVSDHVSALLMHSGCKIVDYCIVNSNSAPEEMVKKYQLEGSQEVRCDYDVMAKLGIHVVKAPIARSHRHYRHDPAALAAVIMNIYKNNSKE